MAANGIAETVAEFHEDYAARRVLNSRLQSAAGPDKEAIRIALAKLDARDATLTEQMRFYYDDVLAPAHAEALQRVHDSEADVLAAQFVVQGLMDDVAKAKKAELEAWKPLKSLSRDCGRTAPERPDNRSAGSGQRTTFGARASA
jgi:hypothetical protein